jgi:hypothetical protein
MRVCKSCFWFTAELLILSLFSTLCRVTCHQVPLAPITKHLELLEGLSERVASEEEFQDSSVPLPPSVWGVNATQICTGGYRTVALTGGKPFWLHCPTFCSRWESVGVGNWGFQFKRTNWLTKRSCFSRGNKSYCVWRFVKTTKSLIFAWIDYHTLALTGRYKTQYLLNLERWWTSVFVGPRSPPSGPWTCTILGICLF